MSARPYPKILRTTEAADATLRTYARGAHLAPFEALILAIGLLRTKDEREAASERAYKFAALWHDLARKLWHRWRSGLWALAREQNAADGLRRDLESAREATRRADAVLAELEQANRDLALDVASLRKMHAAEKGAHERCAAEVARLTAEATVRARGYALAAAKLGTENDRLTSELAEAKRTADKLRIEVERVTEERDTERRLDVTAQEALRADVAREIAANRKLEAELAETRAALATKGATERLAELPDDLAPRLAAIAARRDVEPHVMLANVIKNGISKIEASDKYQDAQKAARART